MYDVEKSEERQVYRIPYGSMNFVPEEVAALILTYAKDIAAKTGHSIKDCVITVVDLLSASHSLRSPHSGHNTNARQ